MGGGVSVGAPVGEVVGVLVGAKESKYSVQSWSGSTVVLGELTEKQLKSLIEAEESSVCFS